MKLLAQTAAASELGPYTALAAVGVIGLLSVLLFWLVTKYIPSKDVQREEIAKSERESREKALADERDSRERISQIFTQSLREFREETSKQFAEERKNNQMAAVSVSEKIDRLTESLHSLAMTINDLYQQDASLSAIRRRKTEKSS